jgi:hypothetical protein
VRWEKRAAIGAALGFSEVFFVLVMSLCLELQSTKECKARLIHIFLLDTAFSAWSNVVTIASGIASASCSCWDGYKTQAAIQSL